MSTLRTPKLLRYLVAGVLTTALIAGVALLWLTRDVNRPESIAYGIHVRNESTERLANRRRDMFIAQAKLIRRRWEPWAMAHQDLLLKVRRADSNDLATLDTVYLALPNSAKEADMSRSDLIVAGKPPFTFTTPDGRTAKFADFTWNAFKPGKQHFAQGDEVAQKAHESGMIGFDNILKYRFRTQRDIALCDSMTIGSTQVTVWASGRITEGKHGGKSSDDNPLGEAQPREIAPRYDFLR